MCTLITSKATDIDENIANQNHATRTRTPKPGYLNHEKSHACLAKYVNNLYFFFFFVMKA
jgi:hypothetical protein